VKNRQISITAAGNWYGRFGIYDLQYLMDGGKASDYLAPLKST